MPFQMFNQTFENHAAGVAYLKEHKPEIDDPDAYVATLERAQETISETIKQEHFNKNSRESTTMERGILTNCKTIQEAYKVLDDNKIGEGIIRYTVGVAFRMTDDEEKKKAITMAETEMESEIKKRETAAHGTEGSHTSSGSELPPFPGKQGKEGDLSASKQPGGNQMGNASKVSETEEFDDGGCVAKHIAAGMSPEEARKACSAEKETHYRETVRKMASDLKELQETVRTKLFPAIESLDKSIKETKDQMKQKPGTITMSVPQGQEGVRPLTMSPGNGVRETTRSAASGGPVDVEEVRKGIIDYDNFLNT